MTVFTKKSCWTYRVIEYTDEDGQLMRAIHEVMSVNNEIVAYSENAVQIVWDPMDEQESNQLMINKLTEALNKPILRLKDFQNV